MGWHRSTWGHPQPEAILPSLTPLVFERFFAYFNFVVVPKQSDDTWKRAIKDNTKQDLLKILVENPEALRDLLQQYRDKKLSGYDFDEDIRGEFAWVEPVEKAIQDFPLDLSKFGKVTPDNAMDVVVEICKHFKKLVEDNGLSGVFWTKSGKVRHERVAQLCFFGVADPYCKANNLDLTPESNSGRGPVDFKISSGYDARVLVEVKWSKNPKLEHGFHTQIKEYEKAESTSLSVYLVIQVNEKCKQLDAVKQALSEKMRDGEPCPKLIVIDGMKKKSASKYKKQN